MWEKIWFAHMRTVWGTCAVALALLLVFWSLYYEFGPGVLHASVRHFSLCFGHTEWFHMTEVRILDVQYIIFKFLFR